MKVLWGFIGINVDYILFNIGDNALGDMPLVGRGEQNICQPWPKLQFETVSLELFSLGFNIWKIEKKRTFWIWFTLGFNSKNSLETKLNRSPNSNKKLLIVPKILFIMSHYTSTNLIAGLLLSIH